MIVRSKKRAAGSQAYYAVKNSSLAMVILALVISLFIFPFCHSDDKALAVVTVHPLATKAAEKAFKEGGNAVDAAVASALTLGVVDGFNSGIGGGCFMLIRKPDGEFIAIDGREAAPLKASRDMYLRDGRANPDLSQTGSLAIGVPGALAAYNLVISKYGKLVLSKHLMEAATIADEGFVLDASYLRRLDQVVDKLRLFPDSANIFLDDNQTPWPI